MQLEVALLLVRLLLAAVFATAGVAKVVDRSGSRQAIIDFGLPAALVNPLAILLPLAELAIAGALLFPASAWWGALGALTLLLVFIAGISFNLARGRKPECRCFGQLHSAPAGPKALLRNVALAIAAGFVVWQGEDGAGPSAVGFLGNFTAAQLATLLLGLAVLGVVAAQWWFLLHLLGQIGRLLVRMDELEAGRASGRAAPSHNGVHRTQPQAGLPVGEKAPTFALKNLHGGTLRLEALRSPGKPVMLFFTDPKCGPCTVMLPEVGRWQEEHQRKLTFAIISRGDPEDNKTKASEHGLSNVLLQEDWEVSEAYQIKGTPSAVLVSPDGKVGSLVAGGVEGIRSLLEHAVGERAQLPMQPATQKQPCRNCGKSHVAAPTGTAAKKIGESVPEVKLPDLEGNTVELKDFRGEEMLIL